MDQIALKVDQPLISLLDAWNFQTLMPDGRIRVHQMRDSDQPEEYYSSQDYVRSVLEEASLVNRQKAVPIGRELAKIFTGNPDNFVLRPEKDRRRIRTKGTTKYSHDGLVQYPFITDYAGGKIEEDSDEVAKLTLDTIGQLGLYKLPSGLVFRVLQVANNMHHINPGVAGLCNIRFKIAVDFKAEPEKPKTHVMELQITPAQSAAFLAESQRAYTRERRLLGLKQKVEEATARLRDPNSTLAIRRMLFKGQLEAFEAESGQTRRAFNLLAKQQAPWLEKMQGYLGNPENRHPAVEKLPEHGISSSARLVAA